MTDEDELLYRTEDGIGWITLNRPRAYNALTFAMYSRLAEICANVDSGTKVLIVIGAGEKAFAAGIDITQFRNFRTGQDARQYEDRIDVVMDAVETCPIPIIAAINGACTGGGAAIAAACDLRLTTQSLKFGFPIARTLGNCLSSNSLARLVSLLGAGRTRELIFTSRLVQADEAEAIGLVAEVVKDQDTLMARAGELAEQLKGHAPLTMRATKEGLRRLRRAAAQVDDHDLVEMCYTSNDFREGMEAFLNKRKPDWTGT